jgi:N-acetylglutamate synthase-like GNAT family acetyltransferase
MIEIIEYNDSFQPQFYQLNIEWLDKYNLTESHDLEILNNPRQTIIDGGGFIWLAKSGNDIVGTAAIIKESNAVYELAKMTVAPGNRGLGISNILLETCINKAKETGAVKLCLFSNHQLTAALKLYEKYGFTYVAVKHSPFTTADIKMERML